MRSRVLSLALVALSIACGEAAENARGGDGGAGGGGGQGGQGGTAGAAGSAGMTAISGAAGSAGSAGSAGTGGGGSGGAAGSAGSAGTAGSGGSGGSAPYNPCPTDGSACRVMPLGDSITDGAGSSEGGGYRPGLFHLALLGGKQITFVGSGENGPTMVDGVDFPRHHEGHSGWTIDDGGDRSGLYPKIVEWFAANPPHIVTLMIGTNDVNIELDLPNAPQRLGFLLDRIVENAPDALIVLAEIVPTTDDTINDRVLTYNAAMADLVATRSAAGVHIVTVDMYGAFTANQNFETELMNDTLHPKDAGYTVMAETWYEAIGELLPATP